MRQIEVFNPQTNGAGATFYANDPLLALSAGKNAPLQFTFHYMKAPYGTDIVDGTALGANENGTLLGKIADHQRRPPHRHHQRHGYCFGEWGDCQLR